MKSVFNKNSVKLTELDTEACKLITALQEEGFEFNVIGSTTTECELNYPLYTNASEAKELYRQVQNELKLKLATNKTS